MNLSEVVPANSNARTQSERHGPAVVQSATLTKADVERREKLQRTSGYESELLYLRPETIRSMGQKRLLTARQAVVLARREKKKIRIQKNQGVLKREQKN